MTHMRPSGPLFALNFRADLAKLSLDCQGARIALHLGATFLAICGQYEHPPIAGRPHQLSSIGQAHALAGRSNSAVACGDRLFIDGSMAIAPSSLSLPGHRSASRIGASVMLATITHLFSIFACPPQHG